MDNVETPIIFHVKSFTKLLGLLLHLANRDKPFTARQEFYQLKDELLHKYGTREAGDDLQHIRNECWTCNGTGKYTPRQTCRNCFGTGVYTEFYTVLERWQLGGYGFHIPHGSRSRFRPDGIYHTIYTDYIRHQSPPYYLAREALYWLFLLFRPRHFFKIFGHSGCISRKFTPLVILGTWLFYLRDWSGAPRRWYRSWQWERKNKRLLDNDDPDGIPF